jgi:drug/metabolite transporter (DMT)-like permease
MQLTVVLFLLLGALFLGERLAPIQIVGCLLTLAGVIGVVWLQAPPRNYTRRSTWHRIQSGSGWEEDSWMSK